MCIRDSLVCIIGLFCTGNSYALLAGMGIGLCDALPFLGTGTIFIPWAILEIVNGRYLMAAVYAVIYTIANLTRELLEPKLVGDKLGISPLAVVISVYVCLLYTSPSAPGRKWECQQPPAALQCCQWA